MTKKQFLRALSVIAKYLTLFGVIFVLFFARIDASISPFAFAFLFACVYLPVKNWMAAGSVFIGSLFISETHSEIISVVCACGIFIVFCILIKRFKKIKKLPIIIVAYALSNLFEVVNAFPVGEEFYKVIISVMVGCVFCFCVVILIIATQVKRNKIPWTIDQKICAAVFVTVFALGLSGLDFDYFYVHKFIAILIILIGVYLFDAKNTLVVAICLGLGKSLESLNLNYVAAFTLLCLVAMAFKSRNRAYSIVALIFTDVVLGTYFDAYIFYDFFAFIPVVAAAAAFIILPKGIAKYYDFASSSLSGNLVSKNTINKNRAGICSRLNNLASVFGEMQNIYKALIQAHIPAEENKLLLAGQITASVCENCQNKAQCYRTQDDSAAIKESLEALAFVGLQRGSVNFLDFPHALTMNCVKINSILSTVNSLIKQSQSREAIAVTLDSGKMLIAQLLSGLNRLMRTFAEDICTSVVFDNERAELIKEELLYKNIVASDCLITKSHLNDYSVSVLVGKGDSLNKSIEHVISRVVRHKMLVDSIDDSDTSGFSIVTVKTAPRYQIVFGVAQIPKNWGEQSGDVFSFLKINNEKTMMALCDGMGAGKRAQDASVLALTLVENFYKAGFPNEIIMNSVNQLLTITGQEVFSALDMAVFNLNTGETDFVKVGAGDGFIKRDREVEVIEAGSLPMGVLEEMQPKITRAVLDNKDYVVLASDGVSDAFGDRVTLANFINNITVQNSQELADALMQECLNRSGRVTADDCTVVAARLMERI